MVGGRDEETPLTRDDDQDIRESLPSEAALPASSDKKAYLMKGGHGFLMSALVARAVWRQL